MWAGVNLSGRVQVLLDVSGSMNQPVPGTNANRMTLTIQAAELGIGLMKPSTKLGLWLFSTKLNGDQDYQELLPMLPISEQARTGGLERLRTVQPVPNGDTGLYDSVLAAYQSARQNYEPGPHQRRDRADGRPQRRRQQHHPRGACCRSLASCRTPDARS